MGVVEALQKLGSGAADRRVLAQLGYEDNRTTYPFPGMQIEAKNDRDFMHQLRSKRIDWDNPDIHPVSCLDITLAEVEGSSQVVYTVSRTTGAVEVYEHLIRFFEESANPQLRLNI